MVAGILVVVLVIVVTFKFVIALRPGCAPLSRNRYASLVAVSFLFFFFFSFLFFFLFSLLLLHPVRILPVSRTSGTATRVMDTDGDVPLSCSPCDVVSDIVARGHPTQ